MAVRELMTWDGANGKGRWLRRKNKETYRIGVKKLEQLYPNKVRGLTRSGTREAANEWWVETEKQLLCSGNFSDDLVLRIMKETHETFRQYAVQLRDSVAVAVIDQRLVMINRLLKEGGKLEGLSVRSAEGFEETAEELLDVPPVDHVVRARHLLRASLWKDIEKFDSVLPVSLPLVADSPSEDRTIETVTKRFLAARKAETKQPNGIKQKTWLAMRDQLNAFLQFVENGSTIDSVNRSEVLTEFHSELLNLVEQEEIKPETAKKRMTAVKQLLRWCFEEEITDNLPRNISSRRLSITVQPSEPKLFDLEQLRAIYNASSDRTKLYLALMANCGFRQADIAALRRQEVNLVTGRIAHARVKTKRHNPPVVNYLLWPETLRLLKEHLENEEREIGPDDLVFLTINGTPVARSEFHAEDAEREATTDAIRSAYFRVQQKLKIPNSERRSLGTLRTTSADMIRKKFSKDLQVLFLAHNAADVADRNYTTSHKDFSLDEPLRWLATQYRLGEEDR